jgi:hypothetical protein
MRCHPALLQTLEQQRMIDNHDPALFEGEADPPAPIDQFDELLEGVLPGTAGFLERDGGTGTERERYMLDILPEGDDDDQELQAMDLPTE